MFRYPLAGQLPSFARQRGDLPDALVAERIKDGTWHYLGRQSSSKSDLAARDDVTRHLAP
jgi:hypothetical protein